MVITAKLDFTMYVYVCEGVVEVPKALIYRWIVDKNCITFLKSAENHPGSGNTDGLQSHSSSYRLHPSKASDDISRLLTEKVNF